MTRPLDEEIRRRASGTPTRKGRPVVVRETITEHLFREIERVLEERHRLKFPDPRYQKDPVGFARDVLGFNPWARQIEILEAARDHLSVAVRSGHKIGKSTTAAILALWFFCSWDLARVIMSSTTARQVDEILWRELLILKSRSGRCVVCKAEDPRQVTIPTPCPHSAMIAGDSGILARTGLKSADFREIVGFTAREAEGVAGISGPSLLYLVDEASGVPDVIFEAIEGNRAGGARIVLFSNPTRTSGAFFDAFKGARKFWHGIHVSSLESPNITNPSAPVIKGLAEPSWVEKVREQYGETSPFYRVRVLGEFPEREEGRIFALHVLEAAASVERRREVVEAGAERERLWIGCDPAGESGTGDESGFSWRRGRLHLGIDRAIGLSGEAHVARILGLVREHRNHPREVPVVVIDASGSIGAELSGKLSAIQPITGERGNPDVPPFELVALRASDRAVRMPQVYDRIRDELAANAEAYVRDGGTVIEDAKLQAELHELEWITNISGRVKLVAKDDLKKRLGRSPDSYDAFALSLWEPLSLRLADAGVDPTPPTRRLAEREEDGSPGPLDPYAAEDEWDRQRRR